MIDLSNTKVKIAPSLLNSNIFDIQDVVNAIKECDENYLHIDVMDGSFVPLQAFGGSVVSNLKMKTDLVLDVHLMIDKPELHLEEYKDASIVTVHAESTNHLDRCIRNIKKMGIKAGVAINPATPCCLIEPVLDCVDQVLIMTVNPAGLQESFIERTLDKIKEIYQIKLLNNYEFDIEVDGNINDKNIALCYEAGANIFVSGGFIFKGNDYRTNIQTLKRMLE